MPSNPATTIGIETLLEHEPFVRSILRGLVSDENQVQDLVQETWVRAMRRPPQEAGAIKGWLTRVAKNLVRDSHRRNATRTHCEHTVSRSEEDTSVAVSEERLLLHQQIVGAVMSLEEPYRSVMILTYYEGLSASEIATKLDRKPATVRSQIHRAHDSLRRQLDADYGNRNGWMLIATPMLKWEKSATAKASGLTIAQLASYAAIAACLVATGGWVRALMSEPAGETVGNSGNGVDTELLASVDGPSDQLSSQVSAEAGKTSNADGAGSTSGDGVDADSALASGTLGNGRAPLPMDWSVLVTQDGRAVEGADVYVRMDEAEQTVPDFGVDGTFGGFLSWNDPGLLKERTDSEGRATYSLARLPKFVWAFSAKGAASLVVEAGSGPEARLELSPAFTTHIQVVNSDGDPVAGVPVVMKRHVDPKGKLYQTGMDNMRYDMAWTKSEGPEGRALFYGEGQLGGRAVGVQEERVQNFVVHLGIPGLVNKTHRLRSNRGSSTERPLRLVKSATGSLNVRILEPDGELSSRIGKVLLRTNRKHRPDGEVHSYARALAGVAHFPMVAVGGELALTFKSPTTGVEWHAVVKGPTSDGEKRTCEIRGASTATIRGRLTGSARSFDDLSLLPLHLYILGTDRKVLQMTAFQVDAEGHFEVALQPEVALDVDVDIQILGHFWDREGPFWNRKDGLRPRWDRGQYSKLDSEGIDLGDVPLAWVPDRLSGSVKDSEGRPLVGYHITVLRDRNRRDARYGTQVARDGSFKLETHYGSSTVVEVSAPDHTTIHRETVQLNGDTKVDIVVENPSTLSGRIIVPKGMKDQSIMIEIFRGPGNSTQDRDAFGFAEPEDYRFNIDNIIPGKARVVFKVGSVPVLEVPNVSFAAGETCTDARVSTVDLTELVDAWSFVLVDENNAPMPDCWLRASLQGEFLALIKSNPSGEATMHLPNAEEITVSVNADGYMAQTVSLSQEEDQRRLNLQMRKGIPIRLNCVNPPALENNGMRAQLQLGLLDHAGKLIPNGPKIYLPRNLNAKGEADVTFPASGSYALLLAVNKIGSPGELVMASLPTRCTFSDFILDVKESDAGKTLDLVLPTDLFQGK